MEILCLDHTECSHQDNFEADLHLESDKAEKSKPSYGEMRTENPRRKNVVNWLNSAPDSELNVKL